MHIFRRSLGIIPFSVGSVGLLACLILATGIWIAGARIDRFLQNLFMHADQAFAMAERQVQRADRGLQETKDVLLAAELGVDQEVNEQKVRDFLAKPEVKSLELKLRSYISEIEGLIKIIETSEEMIRQANNSFSVTSRGNQSMEGTFLDTLSKSRLALLRLLRVASDAEACWMSLNQGRELESNARNLLRMNELVQRQLVEVSDSVVALRDRLASERKSWQQYGLELSSYLKWFQYIGVGIFAWIGMGQYALALCGVLRLKCKAADPNSKDHM